MIMANNKQIITIGNPFEMPIEVTPDVATERSFWTQTTPATDPQAIATSPYKTIAPQPPAPAL